MKRTLLLFGLLAISHLSISQTNMLSTNPVAEAIMLGNYDVQDYMPATVINQPDAVIQAIREGISTDSLHSYLLKMSSFETRHTSSDTTSLTTGIGAARRWVHSRFQQISDESEGRLIPSYLQFDRNVFGMGQHRNIFAVLPGTSPNNTGLVLIEAHLDSRCENVDDINCTAHGMEDNGSGSALVLELARVMSHLAFDRTIVFMTTIGEEQGLYGADAFAKYAVEKNIKINAVLNNDIVGGIICGETASSPGCPGLNDIDSTQVRLFSSGFNNSKFKQLARFTKLEYQEELESIVDVPMMITVMSGEDRSGRGGDHIPFRQQGYASIRFTSANEHGNANTSDPNYHDRQHTSNDVLGVDTDGDTVIDSFFVDFNYLARNAVINGVSASMAASGPQTPDFDVTYWNDQVTVTIMDPNNYGEYRVFVRSTGNDFDTIFTTNETVLSFPWEITPFVHVSVASVDANGIESLFSREDKPSELNAVGEAVEDEPEKLVELYQNRPNPFDEATFISFFVHKKPTYKEAFILISDMDGNEIGRLPTELNEGNNEVLYRHGYNYVGVYAYSLVVDGTIMDTKRMVFAN